MSGRPSMSVVIPAYQAAEFIGDAIRSVQLQEPRPDEIIVVDDGSTDATTDVVASFGSSVELVTKANGGEASARNVGLRTASGEWVAFLDADDRFLPGRLEAVHNRLAEGAGVDVITTDAYQVIGAEVAGMNYGPHWSFAQENQRSEILRRNFVFVHVVARREHLLRLGGFDESIRHTTDWAMWINLILDGGVIGLIDRPLSAYRLHPNSLSADRLAMAEGAAASLESALRHPKISAEERGIAESSLGRLCLDLERELLSTRLARADPGIRHSARRVVRNGSHSALVRARAGFALTAPSVASKIVERRRAKWVTLNAGRTVPRTDRLTGPGADQRPGPAYGRPLVSVVLAFLDEERFLAGAVETVQAQSLRAWELLLVDDGSSDTSPALADRLAVHDPRVRVLRHPDGRNEGLAASRNLGLANAEAGAVAFLDADDRWEPEKLELQLALLAANAEAAMICGPAWHRPLNEGPPVLKPVVAGAPRRFARSQFARALVCDRLLEPPTPSGVLYRTRCLRAVGGVPAGDNLYEDKRAFVAVSLRYSIVVSDRPLSTYTKRPDSLYGSLEHDPFTKSVQRRTFEWWVLSRGCREGVNGLSVVVALVVHRLNEAIRRRARSVWPSWLRQNSR